MLESNSNDRNTYAEMQEEIKQLNRELYGIRKSKEYKIGMFIEETIQALRHGDFKELSKTYRRWISGYRAKKLITIHREENDTREKVSDYFSKCRIAVYTVVFGKYDNICEPLCAPDNIDYYCVTDQNIDLTNSKWKKIDISGFRDDLDKFTNVEKNRFFKMMPNKIFEDYEYSVYIDGNIQIIADLTPFIHKIQVPGIAAHWHSSRDCVYDEMKAALQAKKESEKNLARHKEHLIQENYPPHYGLLECNVLARKHTAFCNLMMEQWWSEFETFSKRDQLSLPYVLFKNKVEIKEVATLGENVFHNAALRVLRHK